MSLADNGSRSPARKRSQRAIGVVAVIVVGVAAVLAAGAACSSPAHSAFDNPFAVDSPWRRVIPPDVQTDPNSAAMIASVQPTRALAANLVEFAVPIYQADAGTPRHTVACTGDAWGVCPLTGWSVPIPAAAVPNSGSDGAMVTVDVTTSTIFEFWQATKGGQGWSASWGAVNDLRGSGWGGAATGSGASRLGGVIRLGEIRARQISHALALQTNNACTIFRSPALKTDGTSTRSDCVPEGAHLQLDPALDLSKLGLTAGELTVATAMQRYGGYVVDAGGAPLSVSFELDTSAAAGTPGEIYQDAGFRWDYDSMEHVPWEKLRVLR
ncbi:hypothetical protein ACXDF8_20750 [Mycolicibacterium sp. CBM1]